MVLTNVPVIVGVMASDVTASLLRSRQPAET
jgi:hypothetical protein